jgi:hypothetical protein
MHVIKLEKLYVGKRSEDNFWNFTDFERANKFVTFDAAKVVGHSIIEELGLLDLTISKVTEEVVYDFGARGGKR